MKNNIIKLSQKRSLCDWVRYIAALLIVNGHLFLFSNPESILTPYMNLGACCVSIFFFFSGYGLMTSYERKGDAYLNGFFRRRETKILFPFLMAYAITLPVYALLRGSIDWKTVLGTLSWGGPYLKFSWYVTEILILYGIFYMVMRTKCDIRKKRTGLTLSVLLFTTILVVTKQPNWYIISLPGFIIGVWFQAYEKRLSLILSQNKVLIAAGAIWFLTWQWHLFGQKILTAYRWQYLSYYIYNIAFVAMIVGVICKLRITPPDSKIIHSSYEVYLMQNCAFIIVSALSMPFIGYWITAICTSALIGHVVHNLNAKLNSIILLKS